MPIVRFYWPHFGPKHATPVLRPAFSKFPHQLRSLFNRSKITKIHRHLKKKRDTLMLFPFLYYSRSSIKNRLYLFPDQNSSKPYPSGLYSPVWLKQGKYSPPPPLHTLPGTLRPSDNTILKERAHELQKRYSAETHREFLTNKILDFL